MKKINTIFIGVLLTLLSITVVAEPAETTNKLICRGTSNAQFELTANHIKDKTIPILMYQFKKGPALNKLQPGECSWMHKPLTATEPSQLCQVLHKPFSLKWKSVASDKKGLMRQVISLRADDAPYVKSLTNPTLYSEFNVYNNQQKPDGINPKNCLVIIPKDDSK